MWWMHECLFYWFPYRLWQGQYQGPHVPSSPGNPIWVIRGKSVGDLKEREGWQWLGICCGCTFASHSLAPIPIHAHTLNTHTYTFELSIFQTPLFSFFMPPFSSMFSFLFQNPSGSIEGEKCRPEGNGGKKEWGVRWEKWKWQGIDCISKNPVAEHKPFWLETWKQEVKRSCQDVFDRASVRQGGSILWESGWSLSRPDIWLLLDTMQLEKIKGSHIVFFHLATLLHAHISNGNSCSGVWMQKHIVHSSQPTGANTWRYHEVNRCLRTHRWVRRQRGKDVQVRQEQYARLMSTGSLRKRASVCQAQTAETEEGLDPAMRCCCCCCWVFWKVAHSCVHAHKHKDQLACSCSRTHTGSRTAASKCVSECFPGCSGSW